MITEKKFNTSVDELCFELPSNLDSLTFVVEFTLFCSYCRGLDFE